jgi:hypothetical protein
MCNIYVPNVYLYTVYYYINILWEIHKRQRVQIKPDISIYTYGRMANLNLKQM